MTEIQQTKPETKTKDTVNFSALVRQMLHEGKSIDQIMAALGVERNFVHQVKHYAIHKAKRPGVRMNPKTGKLVRTYKRKPKEELQEAVQEKPEQEEVPKQEVSDAPTASLPVGHVLLSEAYVAGLERINFDLKDRNRALTAQVKTLAAENVSLRAKLEKQTQPRLVEMPVPQPWSHYTFWQRLRIVFLGRV